MADVQHKNLTGTNLHEPKSLAAVSTADLVYKSNGSGSGAWAKVNGDELDSTGEVAKSILRADGSGNTEWCAGENYSEVTLDLTGTLTRSFPGATAYTDFTLTYDNNIVSNFTYNDATKELVYDGTDTIVVAYSITVAIKRTDTGGSPEMTIAMFEDTGSGFTEITSSRVARSFTGNDVGSMAVSGLHSIANGDKIKLQVKTDAGIDIELRNLNWSIHQ
jgi:hypothetical protein